MVVSFILFFYFLSLIMFSVISHPVYYCGLLVFNALLSSLLCYVLYGFSWYALLFCLVYVGGVYILFIFISVFSPNNSVLFVNSFNVYYVVILFGLCFLGVLFFRNLLFFECSSYLCTINEGVLYLSMCFTLVFGFVVLSLIMCVKANYYR
uniref:NADH dehydrogenase subunit 6 n=1 Tax=Paruterina candelabraria TaxID=2364639 RepID=A0A386HV89_9CEST|nr:NADH dehydrogenase subunit 6 [Paruterina candelabraria]AYD49576.1 NADH dehydrogenase subunit 6 [Paruterina candelabraria]